MKSDTKHLSVFFILLTLHATAAQAISLSEIIAQGKQLCTYLMTGDDMRAKLCRIFLSLGGFAAGLYVMRETKIPRKLADNSRTFAHSYPQTSTALKCVAQAGLLLGALKVASDGAS